MTVKIGFTAEPENIEIGPMERAPQQSNTPAVKKSLVDVHFPDRNLTCTYYNDSFDLQPGDLVFVEGKLEGKRGRVVKVSHTFKIKLSDYKRVIGMADTQVIGEFHLAGSHFITTDSGALNYEQIITWFKAPSAEDETVSGEGDEAFSLHDLGGMHIEKDVADKGYDYFMENRVVYIELKYGKGRAIVSGTKPYEVEFNFDNGTISGLVCSCYCSGACKHQFAAMLQLRETLDIIAENYSFIDLQDYLAIVSKTVFYDHAIGNKIKGNFIIG